jgi:glycosyl transferase family 25
MRSPTDISIRIISLVRSVERRENVSRCMAAIQLPFEFIDAVDGRVLTDEDLARKTDAARMVAAIGRPMTRGEIGCSLSHLEACRQLLASDAPATLVLEDDCQPDETLVRFLSAADNLPAGWDVIHLHWWNARTSLLRQHRLTSGIKLLRFVESGWSSGAYLMSRHAAQKILEKNTPVIVPSDHVLHEIEPVGLQVWGTSPLCVRENHDLSLDPRFTTMIDERKAAQAAAYTEPKAKAPIHRVLLDELRWLKRRLDPKWII